MGYNPLLLNNCIDYANGAMDWAWKKNEAASKRTCTEA